MRLGDGGFPEALPAPAWARLGIAALWLTSVTTAVFAADPPLMTAQTPAKGGKAQPVFFKYDKIILLNGKEIFVDVARAQAIDRPIPPGVTAVLFRVFNEGGSGESTPKSIKQDEIKKIRYWEDLALDEVERLIGANRLTAAQHLYDKLLADAPQWDVKRTYDLRDKLAVAQAVALCGKDQPPDVQNEGLQKLQELLTQNRHLAGLEKAYAEVQVTLATQAEGKKEFRQARDHLEQVFQFYPQNKVASDARGKLHKQAQELARRGATAHRGGDRQAALALRTEAHRMFPDDAEIRRGLLQSLTEFQVLRVAAYEKPGTFEPFNAVLPLEKQIVSLIFDPLLEPDEHGKEFRPNPVLQLHEQQPGGLEHVFQLNPSVFSNGSPLTAEDVAQSLKLLQDISAEGHNSDLKTYVQKVTVLGPDRLSVMIAPHPRPEALFTFPIAPAKLVPALPKRGDAFSLAPIGTGPFMPAKPTPSGDVRLVANPKFRDQPQSRPFLQEVHFQFIVRQGAGQAVDELERGSLHVIADPSPNQLLLLQRAPSKYRTRPFLSNSVWVLAFNYRNPLFANRQLRQAMTLAITRGNILNQYFGVQGKGQFTHRLVTGPFPPQSNAYNFQLPDIKDDQPKAKLLLESLRRDPALAQLLDQPIRLKYSTKGDLVLEQAMAQIKKDLMDVGFNVRLEHKLPNDFVREVDQLHDFDLAYHEITPNNILCNVEPLFDISEEQLGEGGSNYMGYQDQRLNQLFVELRKRQVGDKIWKAQHQIHEYLYTNFVLIPLWRLDRYVAYTSRLKGRLEDGRNIDLPISNTNLFRRTETWFIEPPTGL